MSFFSSLNIIYSVMPSANLQSLPRLRAVHKDGIKHPVYLKGNLTRNTLCVSLCILDSIPVCLSACLFHSVSVLYSFCSVRSSVHPSVYLTALQCTSTYVSMPSLTRARVFVVVIFTCLFDNLSVSLSVCRSIRPSIHPLRAACWHCMSPSVSIVCPCLILLTCLNVFHFVCLPVYKFVNLPFCPCIRLSV